MSLPTKLVSLFLNPSPELTKPRYDFNNSGFYTMYTYLRPLSLRHINWAHVLANLEAFTAQTHDIKKIKVSSVFLL